MTVQTLWRLRRLRKLTPAMLAWQAAALAWRHRKTLRGMAQRAGRMRRAG